MPPQIHPGVQARDLVRVTVEHQRSATAKLPDAALARLGPAWMIHLGIHVRVETILVRRSEIPRRRRLGLRELDSDERFDPLDNAFPWHAEPDGSAAPVEQRLSIDV